MGGFGSADAFARHLGVLDLRSVVALAGTLWSEIRHGGDRVVGDGSRS